MQAYPRQRAAPSPNYNIQWGWNFAADPDSKAKAIAVAYVIKADKRGRVTMAGIVPASGSPIMNGFIGKVAGANATLQAQFGAQIFVYENDAAPDAGTIAATPDMGLGAVLDRWFGDPSNAGEIAIESTSGGATVPCSLPLTSLQTGGPEMGPLQGKDAIPVDVNDIIAILVTTPVAGTGIFQAEIDGRPWLGPGTDPFE